MCCFQSIGRYTTLCSCLQTQDAVSYSMYVSVHIWLMSVITTGPGSAGRTLSLLSSCLRWWDQVCITSHMHRGYITPHMPRGYTSHHAWCRKLDITRYMLGGGCIQRVFRNLPRVCVCVCVCEIGTCARLWWIPCPWSRTQWILWTALT